MPIHWEDLSLGVAMVVGGIAIAVTLRRLIRDILVFFGNHMSDVTEVQANTARAMQSVADTLADLSREVRSHNRVHRKPSA